MAKKVFSVSKFIYQHIKYRLYKNKINKQYLVCSSPSHTDTYLIPSKDILCGFSYKNMKIGDTYEIIFYRVHNEKYTFKRSVTSIPQTILFDDIFPIYKLLWINVYIKCDNAPIFYYYPCIHKIDQFEGRHELFFKDEENLYMIVQGFFYKMSPINHRNILYDNQDKIIKQIYVNSKRKKRNSPFINFY